MGSFRKIVNFAIVFVLILGGCSLPGDVVEVSTVSDDQLKVLGEKELEQLAKIREAKEKKKQNRPALDGVIQKTPNYSVREYLEKFPESAGQSGQDYTVGGYDILDITVYEEPDLSRTGIRVSADGYISFPFIGRVMVDGLTTAEIARLLSNKFAEGQYLIDAHVSVEVAEYRSKQYMVLGSVNTPGTFPLNSRERLLDAISKAGGVNFEQGAKEGMVIRTQHSGTEMQQKVVIRIDLEELLKGGDPMANLHLQNEDLVYIPQSENNFYIIGQVQTPGSYPYRKMHITIVEAISMAGGFTPIASRNKTRIIRMEDGVEKIITVKVDAITEAGKKTQDVEIFPGDVIVVPESFF